MTDLFLIAHKVRGEPAFDIAQHMTCPHCDGRCHITVDTTDYPECVDCHACDGAGHWWIIPTSGHRAFPIMNWPLNELMFNDAPSITVMDEAGPLLMHPEWDGLRDHYAVEREVARSLVDVLGLIHKPLAPIKRRF